MVFPFEWGGGLRWVFLFELEVNTHLQIILMQNLGETKLWVCPHFLDRSPKNPLN